MCGERKQHTQKTKIVTRSVSYAFARHNLQELLLLHVLEVIAKVRSIRHDGMFLRRLDHIIGVHHTGNEEFLVSRHHGVLCGLVGTNGFQLVHLNATWAKRIGQGTDDQTITPSGRIRENRERDSTKRQKQALIQKQKQKQLNPTETESGSPTPS